MTTLNADPQELAKFGELAHRWWDTESEFRPLHQINPLRLDWIDSQARISGKRVVDIGCGGGILSEPLARLGAEVLGADPAQANISAAQLHAADNALAIDYRATTAEALAETGERFDIVLAMEVVEHVADLTLFVNRCAEMVKPGGLMVVATLNRTIKSFALAIVGAEYVLRWLPRGTHQWDKFVTPNELEIALEKSGVVMTQETGVIYNLLADRWQLSTDMDVNYMVAAEKTA